MVLIDGIPGDNAEQTFEWLSGSFLSSKARPGFHFLLTVRHVDGAFDWLQPDERPVSIDLDEGDLEVCCAAILKHHRSSLRETWETEPHPSDLSRLAGANPGRLTKIIEWLRAQPPATATLDRIPRSLTVHMKRTWNELANVAPRELLGPWFAAVAVALDNLTIDDTIQLASLDNPSALLRHAVSYGLIHVDGSLDDGTSRVTAEPSLTPAIAAEFGPTALLRGHSLHADAFPMDNVRTASPYQISSAIYHFTHSDRSELRNPPISAELLRRRACQDGVAAVLDDLNLSQPYRSKPIRRAAHRIADVATRHPDRFVELLVAELHRQSEKVPAELVDDWPPALVPRWVRHPPRLAPGLRTMAPVVDAAWRLGSPWFALLEPGRLTLYDFNGEKLSESEVMFSGASSTVIHGHEIAVADHTGVTLLDMSMTTIGHWRTPSPITTINSLAGKLVVGTSSGVVLVIDGNRPPRHLVGHGTAVTAIAHDRDLPLLVTASLDGTARVWDLSSDALVRILRHDGPVRHVVCLATGTVTADDTGRVHWWSPETGRELRQLRGHDAPVTALCVIDGTTVLSAAADGTMWLWHYTDPTLDRRLTDTGPATIGACRDDRTQRSFLTWNDKAHLTHWDDTAITTHYDLPWDDEARLTHYISTPTHYDLPGEVQLPIKTVFHGPGDHCYLTHAGGVLAVPRQPGHPASASPTRHPIAMASPSRVLLGTPNGLLIHDSKRDVWRAEETTAPVTELAPSADGHVVMVLEDGTAHLRAPSRKATQLDLSSRAHLIGAGNDVTSVIDEDGNLYYTTGDGPLVYQLPLPQVPPASAFARRKFDFVVGTALGEVMLLREGRDPIVATLPHPVTAVVEAGRGWCVIGTSDGSVYRWHPEESLLTALGRHDGPVTGLAGAGTRFAASTSTDGTVRLWDVLHGAEHAMVAGPEPFHSITFADMERLYARSGEAGLWCLDLRATDTTRIGWGLDGEALPGGVIDVHALVPFEIRSVRPVHRVGMSEVRLSLDGRGRFSERVGQDGRLAVPWQFPAMSRAKIKVEAQLPFTAVQVAYVTLDRRDERWLTINLP
jgi:WD40 repeat protein